MNKKTLNKASTGTNSDFELMREDINSIKAYNTAPLGQLCKIHVFGIIVLVFAIIGCKKDWLDIKSDKKQSIPSTLTDFQELMDHSNVHNRQGLFLGEIASDGHFVSEASWSSSTSAVTKNAYTWSHDQPYIRAGWEKTYSAIFYANVVLDGLAKLTPFSQQEMSDYDHIKGQALFSRANSFFSLAQIFAMPYNPVTANTDLGIPLRLNSDITEKSKRSSVAETYDKIIADLKSAEELLPITALYPTRGSKTAVFALLARTYLAMSIYDSAFVYADKCLQLYNKLMNYNMLPTNSNQIGTFTSTPVNTEVIFQNILDANSFLTTNGIIDTSLFNLYSTNDLRKTLFFKVSGSNFTFKGNYHINNTELFSGLATDEIYLIRAECYARKGDKDKAMADLNTLLFTRWKNNGSWAPLVASDANAALVLILNERRKELLLRGIRWSDLRRLNQESQFKITLARTIGGKTYILEPNSYRYTFPIPDDIIQQSGIQQNPEW